MKYQQGDLNGALADLNKAIELDANNRLAFATRAEVKRLQGDLAGALADLSEAIHLNRNNGIAFGIRGEVKLKLGDNHGAIDDSMEANRLNPNNYSALPDKMESQLSDFDAPVVDSSEAASIDENKLPSLDYLSNHMFFNDPKSIEAFIAFLMSQRIPLPLRSRNNHLSDTHKNV